MSRIKTLTDRLTFRVSLVILLFSLTLGFAAFAIVAHNETEEEDQLVIPPERSAKDIAFINSTFACAAPSPVPQSCGVERWSVKTGTDPTVGSVNLSSTTPTTVAALTAFPSPSPIPANSRVAPAETTQWVINGTLVEYKLESDSDYHLVFHDGTNTMVTEIPYPGSSPACVPASSPFLPGISNARCEFDASGLPLATTSFRAANVPVRVVGVGMFDFSHGQTGAAPNQIEIHAILDIVFPKTVNTATSPGNNVAVQLGDASLTFTSVSSAGTTTAVPIDPSTSGTAPANQTLVGPAFNLSTTATVTGPINICVSVPYITDLAAFSKLNILDIEGGSLVNRTTGTNADQKTVCGTLPSLSRVVVSVNTGAAATPTPTPTTTPTVSPTSTPTPTVTPTPSNVATISGQVVGGDGRGVRSASVTLTDAQNNTRTVLTSSLGFYSFDNVTKGQTVQLSASSKHWRFSPLSITVNGDMGNANFVGEE